MAPSPSRRRNRSFDASAQEDSSPEAEARRRAARQEILERGMMMEMRRRERQGSTRTAATSFDHMVDSEGRLRQEDAHTTATTTATDNTELRRRNAEHRAAVLGAAFANPFDDEIPLDQYPPNLRSDPVDEQQQQQQDHADIYDVSRSSTPVLSSPVRLVTPPIVQPLAPSNCLIDAEEFSNHPSEELVDLTPTTSVASLHEMVQSPHSPQVLLPQSSFQANQANLDINEWAQRSTASFYSMPDPVNNHQSNGDQNETDLERGLREMISASEADSQSEAEHVSKLGSEADLDVMSEVSGMTPSTWTEVGSVVSEEY